MKTIKKTILVLFMMIVSTSFAMANCQKIAVVDLNAVVSKSTQVQALKQEQQQKLADLKKWLETVRADVAKQQTQEGKDKLIKKYDADFAQKQESIKKEYAKKLADIDKSISQTIATQAKAAGYDMVLPKGSVLYGGDDITKIIIKNVK